MLDRLETELVEVRWLQRGDRVFWDGALVEVQGFKYVRLDDGTIGLEASLRACRRIRRADDIRRVRVWDFWSGPLGMDDELRRLVWRFDGLAIASGRETLVRWEPVAGGRVRFQLQPTGDRPRPWEWGVAETDAWAAGFATLARLQPSRPEPAIAIA